MIVLVPCKDQKREFLFDALGPLVRQTSGDREALLLTDPAGPPEIAECAASFGDSRLRVCPCPVPGFAAALNFGFARAQSYFVSILLSDDRFAPDAVATLADYRERFPNADFFHPARRHINQTSEYYGGVMASGKSFCSTISGAELP